MKKNVAICLMSLILIYVTVGDFILVKAGIISLDHRSDIDMLVFTPMVAAMVWWVWIQFNRWRLRLWSKLQTYIGILVAVMGAIPLSLFISRIDVGLAVYVPEIIIISICAKTAIWGFWLRLISGDNLPKYLNQQKDPI
ncbi:MAG: hypothetical protein ACYC0V_01430 [Armatimonadota bacterium]